MPKDYIWDNFHLGLRNRLAADRIGKGALQTALNAVVRDGKAVAIDQAVLSTDAVNTTQSIYDPIIGSILGFIEVTNLGATWAEFNGIIYVAARSYPGGGATLPRASKSVDGTNWYNIGIAPPSVAPTVGALSGGAVTCTDESYVYTYYSSTFSHESGPSALSAATVTMAAQQCAVGVTANATSGDNVSNIYLYRSRTSGGSNIYYKVGSNNNSTGNIADNTDWTSDLTALPTLYNDTFPSATGLTGPYNGALFFWAGTRLYPSNNSQFNAVMTDVYWDFPSSVVAARAMTGVGVLVLTYHGVYLLSGDTPERMSYQLLSDTTDIACPGAVCKTDFGMAWVSSYGLELFNGSTITRLSTPLLSKSWIATNIVADAANVVMGYTDRQIVIFTPSISKAVVFDLTNWPEVIVTQTDLAMNTTGLGVHQGPSGLYFLREDSSDRKIYQWAQSGGTQQTMTIQTDEITASKQGANLQPRRGLIDYSGGPFTITTYANNTAIDTTVAPISAERGDPYVFELASTWAHRYSMKAVGKGTIHRLGLIGVDETDGWK